MIDPRVRPGPAPAPAVAALAARVDALCARLRGDELAWLAARGVGPDDTEALLEAAAACRAERDAVGARAASLRAAVSDANPLARREALARHLRVTVPDPRQLRGDLRALRRNLDLDALLEREDERAEAAGARLEVVLEVLRAAPATLPSVAVLRELAETEPRRATRRAAVRALAETCPAWDARSLGVLRSLIRAGGDDPWVRRRALGVVARLPEELRREWLGDTLRLQAHPDDALLRVRAAELVVAHTPALLADAARDPAEVVRAGLVDALRGRRDALGFGRLVALRADPVPAVRARVADALGDRGAEGLDALARLVGDVPLVARFAVDAALRAVLGGAPLGAETRAALERRSGTEPPALARRAALVLAAAEAVVSPVWPLALELSGLRAEERRRVTLPAGADVVTLAHALTIFAADGFGFSLEPRGATVLVTRGDVAAPALWRVLHELRHPSPSKRQGHTHATGRADLGVVRVPPGLLAEEAPTGVPGQRVRIAREEGWAPAVPMVDDFLHALDRGELRVVTPEGVTTLAAPPGASARLAARASLTVGYARYDALRSAALADPDPALRARYLQALGALGFRVTLGAGPHAPVRGPSRPAFAAALVPLAWLMAMDNVSTLHLFVVVLVLAAVLFGRSSLARAKVRRARATVPLVMGGWGTRGKSGTERLKAAVFEGLGVPFLSKTTGCEAMVLHAPPGGHAVELFLFRPFDKATIWEQIRVVDLGARLQVRTFLWECMALNPTYVNLLQAWWMRDDLSTLTNAYPDHEDIQGPTGMDVATVLGGFAPPSSMLVCAEENMRAVLTEEATRRDCTLVPVDRVWRELVPAELMARMPHAEHPANVGLASEALVRLGVDRIEAIGLMAEHVVPDLGALIVYPRARHDGRDVVFVNGMSANDVLSFRHNWRRVGFDVFDHHAVPDEWLVTVVNNRADRVARSRVFAGIVANDANAHRHVFIGTNLSGLRAYLDEAVTAKLAGVVLDGEPARVDALFAHLRLVDPRGLGAACGRRLGAAEDAVAAWMAVELVPVGTGLAAGRAAADAARTAATALEAACTDPARTGLAEHLVDTWARWLAWRAAREAAPEVVRATYRELVEASVIVVESPKSTGDQTMAQAIAAVPPGAVARLMGIQNIKGTGLDFAYQWVAWLRIHGLLGRVADDARRPAVVAALAEEPFESGLACEAALEVLEPWRTEAAVGPLVARLEAHLLRLREARRTGEVRKQSFLAQLAERLLDPVDAIVRAMRGRQVLDDLAARRIAHPQAQRLLRELTETQKGGWLTGAGDAAEG